MDSETHFDPDLARLTITVNGPLERGGILSQGPEILRRYEFGNRVEILLDYRGASVGNISVGDVQAIVEQDKSTWADFASLRCAIVTGDDATYGMGRMFATLSDREGFQVAVFRGVDEALRWLDGDGSLAADPQR